jgi:APA family basic amino acid/polyamine antiporter
MSEIKRSLGLTDAIMLVSGSMIGSGIFIVTASMARNLGASGWLLVAWLVAGLMTVMAALSYGELSGMMHKAGGQYVYIQRAYGKKMGFLYGWTVFSVIQTGVIAAVGMAFAKFTSVFIPFFGQDHLLFQWGNFQVNHAQLLAIASILGLTWLNTQGVQSGKLIQMLFTSTKIMALLGLIVFGTWFGQKQGILSQNLENLWQGSQWKELNGSFTEIPLSGLALVSALGLAMVGSLFSSDAWNNVTFIAGEIKNPQRNLPLSLFFGTLLVTSLYLLANLAYLSLLPLNEIKMAAQDRVGTLAASVIFGDVAVFLMAALIMISTFGCNNGCIMAGGRLFYAMAADGLFFQKAKAINKKGVPGFALWIQCAWACILCLSGRYGDLLEYTTFASLLFYIITIGGLFILRNKEPQAERPYKAFLYPWLPGLYIVLATAFCINLLFTSPVYTLGGLGIVGLGLPVYYLIRRAHSQI